MTTSTVYTTQIRTVTSCAPEVTNCPNRPHVVTETIAISTTVCPVTEAGSTVEIPTTSETVPDVSTSDVYSTPQNTPSVSPSTSHVYETPQNTPSVSASSSHVYETPHNTPTSLTTTALTATTEKLTTSTVYTTQVRTITSCAPEVTNCPNRPHVTTETIAISTTVCPVTETPETTAPVKHTSVSELASKTSTKHESHKPSTSVWTTSTIYTTQVRTITSCAPEVTNCPGKPGKPHVTTETIAISTTVCPVTETPETTAKGSETQAGFTTTKAVETVTKPPYHQTTKYSTSTIYTTSYHTITSCGPEVPDCPHGSKVVTVTIPVSTTVCPVTTVVIPPVTTVAPPVTTKVYTQPPVVPHTTKTINVPYYGNTTRFAESTTKYTTSTIYTTQIRTVTYCGPNIPCSNGPYVTTETIGISTTVCPVTETTAPVPVSVTSTLYTTQSYTVTSCAPEKHSCSVGQVTTTVYPTATTCISQWSSVVRPTSDTIVTITESATGKNSTLTYVRETSTTKLVPEESVSTTAVYALPTTTTKTYEQPIPTTPVSEAGSKPTYLVPIEDYAVQAAAVVDTSSSAVKYAPSSTATNPVPVTGTAGRVAGGFELMTAALAVIAFFL
ncbi:hypothetical protein BGZ61DRAFT_454354 [Ilyonectria robusta]|uniref:uncharacterized protein n=1 Tax=Ilyonectria robusta TaxID=1079257 RepID=UPI001E8D931A|nr:uncharacterized protein BGZ61DRAFT_454354 [Ilyonectria robusta]KAH8686350.1 hypothetical protein BGZ61DRAFT_454354 [Ilyonectria robusta]